MVFRLPWETVEATKRAARARDGDEGRRRHRLGTHPPPAANSAPRSPRGRVRSDSALQKGSTTCPTPRRSSRSPPSTSRFARYGCGRRRRNSATAWTAPLSFSAGAALPLLAVAATPARARVGAALVDVIALGRLGELGAAAGELSQPLIVAGFGRQPMPSAGSCASRRGKRVICDLLCEPGGGLTPGVVDPGEPNVSHRPVAIPARYSRWTAGWSSPNGGGPRGLSWGETAVARRRLRGGRSPPSPPESPARRRAGRRTARRRSAGRRR